MNETDKKPADSSAFSFWVTWAILKSTGVRNLPYKNMRRLSKPEKSEMVRMWKAPKLDDDDIF